MEITDTPELSNIYNETIRNFVISLACSRWQLMLDIGLVLTVIFCWKDIFTRIFQKCRSRSIDGYCERQGHLLTDSFSMSYSSSFVFLVSLIAGARFSSFIKENFFVVILTFVISLLLYNWLNQDNSSQFIGFSGCDLGTGMAQSFFYGYLRIVLPHNPRDGKGLREFQKKYEDVHQIKFAAYKLFVLIPWSLTCHSSLANEFSTSVEVAQELENLELDRAGVKNRSYKNSVYKIKTQGKKKYISAEYATPMKTFSEVMKHNTPWSSRLGIYRKHKNELMFKFYSTLKYLIETDPECCNLCEIIYYDDRDKNGRFLDVGTIILNRL